MPSRYHPALMFLAFGVLAPCAILLKKMGRLEEATPLFREELEGCREVNGATHEDTLFSARNLAKLLDESGRAEEAARLRSEYGV